MRPFFRRGTGKYEERPRDPYARGRQHKEPPQFTWERFPVHTLFSLSRLFSTFRFSFFHPPPPLLSLSLSLQSSTLNPHPSFHPCFGFFTLTPFAPELLPLMNRGGITRCTRGANGPAASAGKRQREGRETVNHTVDIRARITRKGGFVRGDSFSNLCRSYVFLFLLVSRLDVARREEKKKKVLRRNEMRRVTFQIMIIRER